MKVPEPFFRIINPMMRFILRSRFHAPMSNSLMLIMFTGSKSKRLYTTPVRYVRDGDTIRCFSSQAAKWWRNLSGGARVTLTIQGDSKPYMAQVIRSDDQVREALIQYFRLYPQDAAYHEVRLSKDKQPAAEDLEQAVKNSIFVEAKLLN